MMADRATRDEVLEVLGRLVAIDSSNPPGREVAVAAEVARLVASRCTEHKAESFGGGRPNAIGPNVVPDTCKVTIDLRAVPGQNHREIVQHVRALPLSSLPEAGGSSSAPVVVTAREALQEVGGPMKREGFWGYSDGAVYTLLNRGLPFGLCGPGCAEACHRPIESADVRELERDVAFYHRLARRRLTCAQQQGNAAYECARSSS